MAGKGGDLNAELFEDAEPGLERRGVGEQLRGVAVGLAGISAGSYLDGMHAEAGQYGQGLFESLVSVDVFKNAEFHLSFSFSACCQNL